MSMMMDSERKMLLEALADRRQLLLSAADGLTDEQARLAPTVSDLTIGGLIKHVTTAEEAWVDFILHGEPENGPDWNNVDFDAVDAADPSTIPQFLLDRMDEFTLREDQTLAEIIEDYARVGARTERVVTGLDTLDVRRDLAPAPWVEPGASKSVREVLAHLIGETAQHAGHADIIRETIDGKKSMG